jgi:hypothetical protein
VSSAAIADPKLRLEYLGFENVEAHREFRFRVYGRDGSSEFRMRIANAAFDSARVRMQDCPDLCYQVLLRAVAAGLTAEAEAITIGDAELVLYREEHTPAPRRRARPAGSEAAPAAAPRKRWEYRSQPRKASPEAPPAAPIVSVDTVPTLAEGQRVNHAIFGLGVTAAATSMRTVVSFDESGPRSFVTSMLQVEVLSAPHTWETSSRGNNRPCVRSPE